MLCGRQPAAKKEVAPLQQRRGASGPRTTVIGRSRVVELHVTRTLSVLMMPSAIPSAGVYAELATALSNVECVWFVGMFAMSFRRSKSVQAFSVSLFGI